MLIADPGVGEPVSLGAALVGVRVEAADGDVVDARAKLPFDELRYNGEVVGQVAVRVLDPVDAGLRGILDRSGVGK